MRRDLWLGLIGMVVLAGCEKSKVESTETPVTEAPTQATPPPAIVQATPDSAPPALVVPSGPKVDDEVFLVRRFSVPIDGGMRGFREGTKVKVIAIEGSKVTVTGNDVQFDVQAADISVTPPVVQSAPPAAATTTGSSDKPPAPTASEIEKKKQRNYITAEISNLQMGISRNKNTIGQLEAKIKQIQNQMYGGLKSQTSPEARARSAEMDRLNGVIDQKQAEIFQLERQISVKQRELRKLN